VKGDGTVARRSRSNRGGAQQVSETERVRRLWDKLAPKYDRVIRFPERMLFQGGREWVCSQARGDVLEIAVGTGLNLPHYPSDVRLIGIDLSPQMLEVARQRAGELNREVDLRVGDTKHLEFPDRSFDTVVCTLSLCSIPDDRIAVAEIQRVLRPGVASCSSNTCGAPTSWFEGSSAS
jgi:ubiquinone/menaquinone biosynthesis C-methylase UbiE